MEPLVAKKSRAPVEQKQENTLVWSYYYVRQALGWIGILLPFLLILGNLSQGTSPAPSISDYFHSYMRDVFVGAMVAIGIFLLTYKGYENRENEWLSDFWVSSLAGAGAIGVALFPTTNKFQIPPEPQNAVTITQALIEPGRASFLHDLSALVFFVCLFLFCWVLFRRFDPDVGIDDAKRRRFAIYKLCGGFIAVAIAGLAVIAVIKRTGTPDQIAFIVEHDLIFWFEAVGVWAFGVSWLVKGKAEVSVMTFLRRFTG